MAAKNPTFADGSNSVYSPSIDDWGEELQNNAHAKVTASRWNTISDAVWKLQRHSLQVMLTGQAGVYTTDTGADRPVMLYKVYSVAITGASSRYKTTTISGPAFSAAEKALFGGTPLASGNSIHIWARKLSGDSFAMSAYQATVLSPIVDISGDTGIPIAISVIGTVGGTLSVAASTYIVTLLVTR